MYNKHFPPSFWPVWRETMLLVQEDQSYSAQDSTVGLQGKPPSPARNSQGCWKPENFTFTQYFISDIPFFSPLWCWQWQDEKAFWESLPPAARHSCQPWSIFSKISVQSRKYLVLSTNSVTEIKLILTPAKSAPNFCLSPERRLIQIRMQNIQR